MLATEKLVDDTDLPVCADYINRLKSFGITPVVVSKWLNAVSAYANTEQLEALREERWISKIERVSIARRKSRLFKIKIPGDSRVDNNFFTYGPSFTQNDIIHVPDIHNIGYYGQGVRIAIFDTGFRLNHEAFDHLKVLAAYDFIHNDLIVDNESDEDIAIQNHHGSFILSIIGGFHQGELIGPAFKSEFILAKTEDESSETPVEEDYWIAAAEWADSLGADIISSSLGYLDWYTHENMDGRTAPITIAADIAVKKGIIVISSAGNEGNTGWGIISAPADGDSVISVGAVNSSGIIAPYSSGGPTSDGRIKPDVVAMGTGVACINIPPKQEKGQDYTAVSGTSASCPLVAGVAALILSAYPHLTPMQVREALLQTANRAKNPDNRYGFGLVNALEAFFYWEIPPVLEKTKEPVLAYPNPFYKQASFVRFIFFPQSPGFATADIYNILGQHVKSLGKYQCKTGLPCIFLWDGLDQRRNFISDGIYFCRITTPPNCQSIKFTIISN
ncbi:S8 family peptidase [candidate division KSB1 bacterium]|nr:S8 family peptidase [candidate division KSB1 bacterium]